MAYSDVILADSPVIYLPLNGSLTNLGTSGTYIGALSAPNSYVTGILGEAGRYQSRTTGGDPGGNNFVGGPATGMTMECWVKTTATAGGFMGSNSAANSSTRYMRFSLNSNGTVFMRYGNTTLSGTVPINDGNWHHLVGYVRPNGSWGWYQDGVSHRASTRSDSGTTDGRVYLGGDSSTNVSLIDIDEPAWYNYDLSAERIAAHYQAATGTSVSVAAELATATGQAEEPTVKIPDMRFAAEAATATTQVEEATVRAVTAIAVDLMTGSAEINEPSKLVYPPVTSDYVFFNTVKTDEQPMRLDNDLKVMVFEVAGGWPAGVRADEIDSATVRITNAGAGASTRALTLHTITAPVGSNSADLALSEGVSFSFGTDTVNVNIKTIVDPEHFFGFAIKGPGSGVQNFYSMEDGTPSRRPLLRVAYTDAPQDVVFDAEAATATSQAEDATVSVKAVADVLSAELNAEAYEPEVYVEDSPDAVVEAPEATAHAVAQDATAVAVKNTAVEVDEVPNVDAEAQDAEVVNKSNAIVDSDSMNASIAFLSPLVNNEEIVEREEDGAYFISTTAQDPAVWMRLNESVLPLRARGKQIGDHNKNTAFTNGGVSLGNPFGPNGRRFVEFDGTGYIGGPETAPSGLSGAGGDQALAEGTLEFSIRTTKRNQFVMRIDDDKINPGANSQATVMLPRDIYMVDGRLQYRYGAGSDAAVYWTGFTNLADGKWHHIVIAAEADRSGDVFSTERANVYVDGKFEVRGRSEGVSFPDYIGARPPHPYYGTPLPAAQNFVGAMAEVAWYNGNSFVKNVITRQYDNFFGYVPFYADAATVTATAHEATVKTDVKTVLIIDMYSISARRNSPAGKPDSIPFYVDGNIVGIDGLDLTDTNLTVSKRVGNLQFFSVNAMLTGRQVRGLYSESRYDERTGEPRMINLDVDVDLEQYDVVHVLNYPQNSNDFDFYEEAFGRNALYGGLNGRQQVERVMNQIQAYVVGGGGVFVTDPNVAQALGIISDIDWVPTMRERRNPTAYRGKSLSRERDLRGALINPWGVQESYNNIPRVRPTPGPQPNIDYDAAANFFADEHSNNKQRVVNLVEGLTDMPGEILTDALMFSGPGGNGDDWAEKWESRPEGLNLGDEFWIMGTQHAGRGGDWGGDNPLALNLTDQRTAGYSAAPLTAILAGVPVTTFATRIWEENEYVLNPYRDHAVSIVVRPGDTLRGEVIAGKVYVNFTEGLAEFSAMMMHSTHDIVPPNSELRQEYWETDESRSWSASTWRGSWGGATSGGTPPTNSIIIDGDRITVVPGESDALSGLIYTARYPQRSEDAPQMHYRGLQWLASDPADDGKVVVGANSADATGTMNEPTITGGKKVDIYVEAAEGIADIYNDKDSQSTDATVTVFAAEASAVMHSVVELVEVGAAEAVAEMYEIDNIDLRFSDFAVLRLPSSTATITMEER